MTARLNAPRPAGRRAAGFTLVETLAALTVTVILVLALLQVFDANNELARVQTQVADMQQSLRVAQTEVMRLARMTGRGGLPAVVAGTNTALPGSAMTVADNVADGTEIAPGVAGSPTVRAGTDVLTLRGVFRSPVYQLAATGAYTLFDGAGALTTNPAQAATGVLLVQDPSPTTGLPQDLTPLADAVTGGFTEALVLVDVTADTTFAVVELDPANSTVAAGQVTLAFFVQGGSHPEYATLYRTAGNPPQLPAGLRNPALVGILEEVRFYVRDGDSPTLSTARMFPATQVPHSGTVADTRLDLADNVVEFQVALGFDSTLGAPLQDRNADGRVDEGDIVLTETADGSGDDWFFNSTEDDDTAAPWSPPWDDDDATATPPRPDLFYLRVNTLARTQRPERNYQAPIVVALENGDPTLLNTTAGRQFRRQLLTTVIDLRNL